MGYPGRKRRPPAYFSTFPFRRILADVRKAGAPATLSYSAGTFICNALLYHALHGAATMGFRGVAGFMHVPNDPRSIVQREGTFGMSRHNMSLRLVGMAVEVAVKDTVAALKT